MALNPNLGGASSSPGSNPELNLNLTLRYVQAVEGLTCNIYLLHRASSILHLSGTFKQSKVEKLREVTEGTDNGFPHAQSASTSIDVAWLADDTTDLGRALAAALRTPTQPCDVQFKLYAVDKRAREVHVATARCSLRGLWNARFDATQKRGWAPPLYDASGAVVGEMRCEVHANLALSSLRATSGHASMARMAACTCSAACRMLPARATPSRSPPQPWLLPPVGPAGGPRL